MAKKIISHLKEMPSSKIGKWAFGLSIFSIASGQILGIFAAIISPWLASATGEANGAVIGFSFGAFVIIMIITTFILNILAFKKGERSWATWVGLIMASFSLAMLIFLFVGELLFPH